ncbi:MAG: hypothetical protein ABSG31_00745 [Tepidisphaeraceae bacterium]
MAATNYCRADSELFSEYVSVPPVQAPFEPGATVAEWTQFNVYLTSEVTLPAQSATDVNTNPYAANGTASAGQSGATMEFQGNTIPPINQNVGQPAGTVQFGIVGPTNGTPIPIKNQEWLGGQLPPPPLGFVLGESQTVPVVNVTPNPAPPASPPMGSSFKYITTFVQFSQDGTTGGEWVEFPFLTGQQPTLMFSGQADPADPITFSNAGFQISNTLIPLDDLNISNDPPPGYEGSTFTSMSLPVSITPEPASLSLLALCSVILAARRRKRNPATA